MIAQAAGGGPQNPIQGDFAEAFVAVLAAAAGMIAAKPNPDRGIDLWVSDGDLPPFELQVKSTRWPQWVDRHLHLPLEVAAYDRLRAEVSAYRFLIVVVVPPAQCDWTADSGVLTILRRRAYYLNLRGAAATANVATTSVSLPSENLLTPDVLRAMVEGRCQ